MVNIKHTQESWNGKYTVWYRNPIELIQNLFGNLMYKDDMVYTAGKHINPQGMCLYSEMHWSDWWWNTQVYIFHILEFLRIFVRTCVKYLYYRTILNMAELSSQLSLVLMKHILMFSDAQQPTLCT